MKHRFRDDVIEIHVAARRGKVLPKDVEEYDAAHKNLRDVFNGRVFLQKSCQFFYIDQNDIVGSLKGICTHF